MRLEEIAIWPKSIDPITASVVQGALENIAVEMGYKLMRMSYSSIIRESEDFGAALSTPRAGGSPNRRSRRRCSRGRSRATCRGILKPLAERGDTVRPGDVIMHNDAYDGASHGRTSASSCRCSTTAMLVGFSATTAHHLDIGALTPG